MVVAVKYAHVVGLVNSILDQYGELKLRLRTIFYRLGAMQAIPLTENAYKYLSRVLVRARERGDVDEERIDDPSRQVLGDGDWGFDTPEQFLDAAIAQFKLSYQNYMRPLWTSQPNRVFVAVEKDAVSAVLLDAAERYRVKVYPIRGYSSYTYVRKLAKECTCDKHNVILYFGDYDGSGRDIERDFAERLRRYGAERFEVRRVAITEEQIRQLNLPPMPADQSTLEKLRRDPRTKRYGLKYAVELDAIEPLQLQALVAKAIESCMDPVAWDIAVRQLEEERARLEEVFKRIEVKVNA